MTWGRMARWKSMCFLQTCLSFSGISLGSERAQLPFLWAADESCFPKLLQRIHTVILKTFLFSMMEMEFLIFFFISIFLNFWDWTSVWCIFWQLVVLCGELFFAWIASDGGFVGLSSMFPFYCHRWSMMPRPLYCLSCPWPLLRQETVDGGWSPVTREHQPLHSRRARLMGTILEFWLRSLTLIRHCYFSYDAK